MNDIHDHREELRSSDELLTAEKGSNSIGALNRGDSLFKKTVIPGGERKWITIEANPSPRDGLPTRVSKMFTKMVRHYDQDEREEDGSYHWETVK